MASGSFKSNTYSGAGTGYRRYVEVSWSSSNSTSTNQSTITWNAYIRSPDSSTTKYVYAKNISVTINGSKRTLIGSTAQKTYKNNKLGSGSITVTHGSNGLKDVSVSISAEFYYYGTPNSTYSGKITMTRNPVYTLSISAGTGSKITVNRTSCTGVGSTGNLSAGTKKLCYGDKLKITFSPNTNYSITTHKVNNSTFNSGNTHTVSGNVSVSATATPLKSTVAATDANIGSASMIAVTRYNSAFTHTITYNFQNSTGTICTKSTSTSFSWVIPEDFYKLLPNAKSGICTLTITTYNGNTSLGSNTYKMTIGTNSNTCSPEIRCSVKDINEDTIQLTGDENILVRYKSTAECTIEAIPKYFATISQINIGSKKITDTQIAVKQYTEVQDTNFIFTAVDSRGYSASETLTPTIVPYIPLTCNPIISRPTPTGGEILMDISGNVFRGSFGVASNLLKLMFRYKEKGGVYGDWYSVDMTKIIYGTSTYRSDVSISLGENFDYQKEYTFEIKAIDGTDSVELSNVCSTITVQKGIPIFDWGENDFNVNVDFSCQRNLSCNGNVSFPNTQSILWGDIETDTGWYMTSEHSITLPKKISECLNGIVLVFSAYTDNTVRNYNWHSFFIPKYYTKYNLNKGGGTVFLLVHNSCSFIAQKYLYINDTTISGNDINKEANENAVIPYRNNNFVLRYVLEV